MEEVNDIVIKWLYEKEVKFSTFLEQNSEEIKFNISNIDVKSLDVVESITNIDKMNLEKDKNIVGVNHKILM
jgi:hypothetical protein